MDNDDVQHLAVALQTSLRRHTPSIRISRAAALTESRFILPVIHALRTACLLSSLTASDFNVASALQQALAHEKGLAIVIHQPSQQIFVINRALFIKRWCDTSRRDFFYAVGVDDREAHNRVKVRIPESLANLLAQLYSKVEASKMISSTEIIVLKSMAEAVHGIALAGWLLEYDVIYFYDGHNKDVSRNSLAGLPLVIIYVKLNDRVLYQYTFPLSITDSLSDFMAIKESSIQNICEAIKERLVERAHGLAELDCKFEVIYQHITMDRVAL